MAHYHPYVKGNKTTTCWMKKSRWGDFILVLTMILSQKKSFDYDCALRLLIALDVAAPLSCLLTMAVAEHGTWLGGFSKSNCCLYAPANGVSFAFLNAHPSRKSGKCIIPSHLHLHGSLLPTLAEWQWREGGALQPHCNLARCSYRFPFAGISFLLN